MTYAIKILALVLLFSACGNDRPLSSDELVEWYVEQAESSPQHGPLYYRGSDDQYHYFRIRALDDWFLPRVPRDEIDLLDIRPLLSASDEPFPGYYAVDPVREFMPIDAPTGVPSKEEPR